MILEVFSNFKNSMILYALIPFVQSCNQSFRLCPKIWSPIWGVRWAIQKGQGVFFLFSCCFSLLFFTNYGQYSSYRNFVASAANSGRQLSAGWRQNQWLWAACSSIFFPVTCQVCFLLGHNLWDNPSSSGKALAAEEEFEVYPHPSLGTHEHLFQGQTEEEFRPV